MKLNNIGTKDYRVILWQGEKVDFVTVTNRSDMLYKFPVPKNTNRIEIREYVQKVLDSMSYQDLEVLMGL